MACDWKGYLRGLRGEPSAGMRPEDLLVLDGYGAARRDPGGLHQPPRANIGTLIVWLPTRGAIAAQIRLLF